jgi:hypothetical protein
MVKTCPKYPLMKTIGIQQAILLYAKEAYEPILKSLDEIDSEKAELMIDFINLQLEAIETLREKIREQFKHADLATNKKCDIDFVDLDITCYPVENDEKQCIGVEIPDLSREAFRILNIWKVE